MKSTIQANLLLAFLAALMCSPSKAYPIYKFGLYAGDASTADACGANGSRNKCFAWDLGEYPECYKFSETESYSGAVFDSTSLTYDLHPTCTDCNCNTGAGRKGTTLGTCEFFNFGGVYWLKLECILESDADSCPDDYVECDDVSIGASCRSFDANNHVLQDRAPSSFRALSKFASGVHYTSASPARVEVTLIERDAAALGPFRARKPGED